MHAAKVMQMGHTLGLFLLPRGLSQPLLANVGSGSGAGSSGSANSVDGSAHISTAEGASAGFSACKGSGTSRADLAFPMATGVAGRSSRDDQKTRSEAAPVLYQKHVEQIRMPEVVQVIPGVQNKGEHWLLSVRQVHLDWFRICDITLLQAVNGCGGDDFLFGPSPIRFDFEYCIGDFSNNPVWPRPERLELPVETRVKTVRVEPH